jgi:hypothetical protein
MKTVVRLIVPGVTSLFGFRSITMILRASTTLETPAERAWGDLKLRDTCRYITRWVMYYSGSDSWPEVLMSAGTEIKTKLHLFCLLPGIQHIIRVVGVDESSCKIVTNEHGGLIRVWNHTMRVEPVSASRCRYTDRIEIDARWVTLPIWLFAFFFYRYRQRGLRRLTGNMRTDRSTMHRRVLRIRLNEYKTEAKR